MDCPPETFKLDAAFEGSSMQRMGRRTGLEPSVARRESRGLVGVGGVRPYYSEGGIQIFNCDARELLPLLTDFVLVTDPPYGVNLGKHKGANEKRPGYLVKGEYHSYDDTPENYREIVAPILCSAIGKAKRAAVFGVPPNIWLLPAPSAIGGMYLPAGCGRTPWGFQNLAPVLFYGCAPNLEKGAKNTVMRSTQTAEPSEHPCPKPLQWLTWLVNIASDENDLVVDVFLGSGTTLRAAKELGRQAIGCDIEERYCEIAARGLAQDFLPLGGGGAEHGDENGESRNGACSPTDQDQVRAGAARRLQD